MIGVTNGWHADEKCIHIGLVNNMPDSALEATERQFRALLTEATEGLSVRLSLFAIPEVPRSEETRRRIGSLYSSTTTLWDSQLDGLIVTGAEPVAANLIDEPFWKSLTQLVDWAKYNTYSSVWSCLAAQAFVLRMDGIKRNPLGDKLFGVFECVKEADHLLTAGVPFRYSMPHSRWNDIPVEAVSACGYNVLTRLKNGMVDAFVKPGKHLSVFFQGHPEYDPASLLLEYRRDIRRFLNRERDSYPAMPQGYFDEDAAAALTIMRARAMSDRCEQSFAGLPTAIKAASVRNSWRTEAVQFYRNWLHYLSEQKDKRSESRPRPAAYTFNTAVPAVPGCLAPEAEAG